MYINVEKIFVDYDSHELVIVDSRNPIFSWTAQSDGDGGYQHSYSITVSTENDAGAALPKGDTSECMGEGLSSAVSFEGKDLGKLVPQTLPPVTEQKHFGARNIYRQGEDSYILDFGENIAGIGCLKIPEDIKAGTKIVIEYDEELFEGDLGKETLRRVRFT